MTGTIADLSMVDRVTTGDFTCRETATFDKDVKALANVTGKNLIATDTVLVG